MNAGQVAACIVTRGDRDLSQVSAPLDGFGLADGYVWNGGAGDEDLSVYGRYAAIERTTAPVIYCQDDDVIVPRETVEALIAAYEPGKIVANMPAAFRARYPDSCLLGFGAVFDRDLPVDAFDRFFRSQSPEQMGKLDLDWFRRTCDVVFTTLTPRVLLDLPVTILDYAYGDDRMFKQPDFEAERARMLELARRVRDG